MPDLKEKLVDILGNSGCAADVDTYNDLADHLIANGVTFATDNNVGHIWGGYNVGFIADKWIPVSEPPKENGCYLISCDHWWDGKPVAREAFWNGSGWRSCYDKGKITTRVTHWMPLPQTPKGE